MKGLCCLASVDERWTAASTRGSSTVVSRIFSQSMSAVDRREGGTGESLRAGRSVGSAAERRCWRQRERAEVDGRVGGLGRVEKRQGRADGDKNEGNGRERKSL